GVRAGRGDYLDQTIDLDEPAQRTAADDALAETLRQRSGWRGRQGRSGPPQPLQSDGGRDDADQDAATHDRRKELLEAALVRCQRQHEADHAAVHAPEDHLFRKGPEPVGGTARLLDQAEERVRHDADEHRVIEGEDQPDRNQLEARVDLRDDAGDQPDQQDEVDDQVGDHQPEMPVARGREPVHAAELRTEPDTIDDDGDQLGGNEGAEQGLDVEQGADRDQDAAQEKQAHLDDAGPGQARRVLQAPLADGHADQDQVADDLRGHVTADRALRKEGVLARQLELDQDADRRSDDQRGNGGQHRQARDGHGHAAEPADQPDKDSDDGDQDRKTEDGSRQQVSAQEGEHVYGDPNCGHQAQGLHGSRSARSTDLIPKQPGAEREYAQGDPGDRAGMHMGEQDLPWQDDEVKAV